MFESTEAWREKLNQSQVDYLPLILNCLLGVQILSTIRDPIVIDVVPLWLIIVDGFLLVFMGGLAVYVRARKDRIKASVSHTITMLALLSIGFKVVAMIAAEGDPYPMYITMIIFASSLCFLRHFYLLLTGTLITLAWLIVGIYTLTIIEIVSTLTAITIGGVLAILVLDRRITSMIKVFTLVSRVEALENIVPMCASCKKIRNPEGAWKSIESFVESQEGVQVSHGVCSDCSNELYGDYLKSRKEK